MLRHAMPYQLFYERSTLCLLLDQLTRGSELHLHFDLLKAASIAYQSFADEVDRAIIFVFKAEVVVHIHTAFDDLTTAIAFYVEGVIIFISFGGCAAEKFFKEAHGICSLYIIAEVHFVCANYCTARQIYFGDVVLIERMIYHEQSIVILKRVAQHTIYIWYQFCWAVAANICNAYRYFVFIIQNSVLVCICFRKDV